ncbi:MAG: signal recognition particle-docking protein FtsY [Gammaproteobacteria bacterium]
MNSTTAASGFFHQLRERLQRAALHIAPGTKPDEAVLDELETQLLQADVGVEASAKILAELRTEVRAARITDASGLRASLRDALTRMLTPVARPLHPDPQVRPWVILTVGVNGVGKTTSIAKLARRFQAQGLKPLLAAGDTFRAAAVEQLQIWGKREQVEVIAQAPGADPAAVAHDAWQAAKSRGSDILIVDTAGRLHTQSNLMDELKKIRRVLAHLDPAAPHECLLVLDAGTGQNALRQIEQFHAAVQVTGLVITKLDGSAKGGVLLAAAERFRIPIRYLGVGEQANDLLDFSAADFAAALVPDPAP